MILLIVNLNRKEGKIKSLKIQMIGITLSFEKIFKAKKRANISRKEIIILILKSNLKTLNKLKPNMK